MRHLMRRFTLTTIILIAFFLTACNDTSPIAPTPAAITDNQAPTINFVLGTPNEGSTINSAPCYFLGIQDDHTPFNQIAVSYYLDNEPASAWSTDGTSKGHCFSNVADGPHTMYVQAKDEFGSISPIISRKFTMLAVNCNYIITFPNLGQVNLKDGWQAFDSPRTYGENTISVASDSTITQTRPNTIWTETSKSRPATTTAIDLGDGKVILALTCLNDRTSFYYEYKMP